MTFVVQRATLICELSKLKPHSLWPCCQSWAKIKYFLSSPSFCEISSKWDQSMPRTRFRILREAAKKSSVTLVGARGARVWINYSLLLVLSRIPQRAVILSRYTSHQRATSSRRCGAEKWRSTVASCVTARYGAPPMCGTGTVQWTIMLAMPIYSEMPEVSEY